MVLVGGGVLVNFLDAISVLVLVVSIFVCNDVGAVLGTSGEVVGYRGCCVLRAPRRACCRIYGRGDVFSGSAIDHVNGFSSLRSYRGLSFYRLGDRSGVFSGVFLKVGGSSRGVAVCRDGGRTIVFSQGGYGRCFTDGSFSLPRVATSGVRTVIVSSSASCGGVVRERSSCSSVGGVLRGGGSFFTDTGGGCSGTCSYCVVCGGFSLVRFFSR